ncbi:MAG: TIGR02450 family Trp-rich protein [Cyanobacteria bacterium RI_101]|jgi:tryptophan-rich hypothetical protein|nr:TIGR02450 family Trp-rich protein [Cyanobacteria bacterium RI_101]
MARSGKQKFPHLLGSQWTARQDAWGWRHFRVVNRRQQGKWVFAELAACCDPQTRFWINAQQLQNRDLWRAGLQPLTAETASVN